MKEITTKERLADRSRLIAIADLAEDSRLIHATLQDELDMLTVESVRMWSRSAPTPENTDKDGHLIPPVLLGGFIAAAGRRRRKQRKKRL